MKRTFKVGQRPKRRIILNIRTFVGEIKMGKKIMHILSPYTAAERRWKYKIHCP